MTKINTGTTRELVLRITNMEPPEIEGNYVRVVQTHEALSL